MTCHFVLICSVFVHFQGAARASSLSEATIKERLGLHNGGPQARVTKLLLLACTFRLFAKPPGSQRKRVWAREGKKCAPRTGERSSRCPCICQAKCGLLGENQLLKMRFTAGMTFYNFAYHISPSSKKLIKPAESLFFCFWFAFIIFYYFNLFIQIQVSSHTV